MDRIKWTNWPLAYKGVTVITILILTSVMISTFLAIRREQASFRAELLQQAELLVTTLEIYSRDDLYYLDVDSINDVFEYLGQEELMFSFGRVFDPEGRILADAYDDTLGYRDEIDPLGKRLLESEDIVFEWQADQLLAGTAVRVGAQNFGAVVVGLSTAPLTEKTADLRYQGVVTALVAGLVGTLVAVIISRTITNPIRKLTDVAQQFSQGNLAQRVPIQSGGEIGVLANTLNFMADEMERTLGKLERRTRALEVSGEISRSLSTILDRNQLVSEVVEQLQSAFGYYHAHIYLFDEVQSDLVMVGGTGKAGQSMLASGHKLTKGQGLVGRAADANQIVLISDVSQDASWLPNPLLPETKSEVAVPIAVGDKVLGVLDVQHNVTDGLSEVDANLIQSIANQTAIALQNAQLYTQTRQRADRETMAADIAAKIQRATTIEDVLQVAARELGQAFGTRTSAELHRVTSRSMEAE